MDAATRVIVSHGLSAPTATIVPIVALPASATNSRVISLEFGMSTPRLRIPFALRDCRHELVKATRRKCQSLALLGALIGRHQHTHDFDAVVDSDGNLAVLDHQSGTALADEVLDPPTGFFGLADTSGT